MIWLFLFANAADAIGTILAVRAGGMEVSPLYIALSGAVGLMGAMGIKLVLGLAVVQYRRYYSSNMLKVCTIALLLIAALNWGQLAV